MYSCKCEGIRKADAKRTREIQRIHYIVAPSAPAHAGMLRSTPKTRWSAGGRLILPPLRRRSGTDKSNGNWGQGPGPDRGEETPPSTFIPMISLCPGTDHWCYVGGGRYSGGPAFLRSRLAIHMCPALGRAYRRLIKGRREGERIIIDM